LRQSLFRFLSIFSYQHGEGSMADTDGTWGAAAMVGYRIRHGSWLAGYRHFDVKLDGAI